MRTSSLALLLFLSTALGMPVSAHDADCLTDLVAGVKDLENCAMGRTAPCNLKGLDLSSHDLSNTKLRGCNLQEAKLGVAKEADFEGADLTNAYLNGQNAAGKKADFFKAKMKGVTMTGAKADDASFEEAELERVVLDGISMARAKFSKAKMPWASLKGVFAPEAVFDEAELTGVILDSANLCGPPAGTPLPASFIGAKMAGASLINADANGVHFDFAEMDEAIMNGIHIDGAFFNNAKLQSVCMITSDGTVPTYAMPLSPTGVARPVSGIGANFEEANISGEQSEPPKLKGADFTDAIFKLANMKAADLSDSTFLRANFEGTYLENASGANVIMDYITTDPSTTITDCTFTPGCSFQYADLSGLSISDTNLHSAVLSNAKLVNTILEDAVLCQVKLDGADLSGARISDADLSGTESNPTDMSNAIMAPGVYLDDVDLSYSLLHYVNLKDAQLSDVTLVGVHARYADFSGTDVRYADFRGSDLTNTNWVGAQMSGAIFAGASMYGSDLTMAEGDETSFCGAMLTSLPASPSAPALPASKFNSARFYKSFFGTQCHAETGLVTSIGALVEGCDFSNAYLGESDFQGTVFGTGVITDGADAYGAQGFPNPPAMIVTPPPTYKLVSEALEWPEALEVCQRYGKTLAFVEDDDPVVTPENAGPDNTDIKNTFNGVAGWIGLGSQDPRDSSVTHPTLRWIMGFSLFSDYNSYNVADGGYINFAPGQPNNPNNNRCVHMDTSGMWAARDCKDKLPFVCGPLPPPEGPDPPPPTP